MRDLIRNRRPKCRACQVTSSPGPMRPEVTPPIAFSFDRAMEPVWASMLRDRSKHAAGEAAIQTVSSMTDNF